MKKSELIQRFGTFLQHPNVQERGELELAHYIAWYFVTQIRDEHEQQSIIPELPRYIAAAMRNLRESGDPQVTKFRQLYLAARGEQAVPDFTDTSITNAGRMPTISLVSRLMGKVTGDYSVENGIKTWYNQIAVAAQNLRDVMRRYLVAEVEVVREQCVIVKKSGFWNMYYYQAFPLRQGLEAPYHFRYYPDDKPIHCQLGDNRPHDVFNISCRSYPFHSWEDVANWYCSGLHSAWFRVEQTLPNRNWWQKQTCKVSHRQNTHPYKEGIDYLDVWTPQPGIERQWYTNAMLEAELSRRLDRFENGFEPRSLYEIIWWWMKRPIADEYSKATMTLYELKKGF